MLKHILRRPAALVQAPGREFMGHLTLPLITSRLMLRRFTDGDAAAFQAYRSDPLVAQYQSWESCSAEEAERFVRHQSTQPAGVPGEWLQIAIARKDTNALAGDCGVHIHAPDPRQATVGFTLARVHQGQGYATEALLALMEALFRQPEIHRVNADTDVENTAAWKLMERLGMRREGHLKRSLWFKGRWADQYLYAILREDWCSQSGT